MDIEKDSQEALARLINMAVDGLEGAANFAKAEIPIVIEELLLWKLLFSLSHFVLGCVIMLIGLYFLKTLPSSIKKTAKAFNEGEAWTKSGNQETSFIYDIKSTGLLYSVISLLLIGTSTMFLNLEWLQILVAPRVYLLEYSSSLLK